MKTGWKLLCLAVHPGRARSRTFGPRSARRGPGGSPYQSSFLRGARQALPEAPRVRRAKAWRSVSEQDRAVIAERLSGNCRDLSIP